MSVQLRGLEAKDVAPIEAILRANAAVFNEVEVATAVGMLASGLDPVEQASPDAYRFIVAERAGKVAGYALFARTPLTQGTHDLYWIATDPKMHGSGAGPALLRGVEEAVRKDGGRLVVLETSSRSEYARARRFYEKHGYKRVAVIEDFYRDGDDKVIYARRVDREVR
jgi:ribosomal protein S18 acetylase RimI-like enzyme